MKVEEKFIRREMRLKLLVVAVLFICATLIILKVDNMLVSLVIAMVITYSLNPLVSALERGGLDRTTAVLIPYFGLGAIFTFSIVMLSPLISAQIDSINAELPVYQEGLKTLADRLNNSLMSLAGPMAKEHITDKITPMVTGWLQSSLSGIPVVAGQIFTISILAPFFAFFMLKDGRVMGRRFLSFVPNSFFELALNLTHQINQQMGGFIRAKALESVIVATVTWIGLALIGFPYSTLLAVFAGITNLIPYVGPIIGMVPAFVIALVNKDTTVTILLMSTVYLVGQIIDMIVIIPLVVAKIVNLHPVTVVVVIIIGSQLMGILGMIISIPVASVIKLTTTAIYNHIIGFRV
ncbi:MAG: AI-2E family transporter [Bdellovibrionales bacterium]